MNRYSGTTDYQHGTPSRTGLMLVNLGTPDDPSPRAVRRYLAEFLSDPRVIEMPRLLWWLILHGVILRVRPKRSAHAYSKIWTPEGSPLLTESRALTDALRSRLRQRYGDRLSVELAMTYGQPSIPQALDRFARDNVQRLLVLPLYPQYSATSTGAIFDRLTADLTCWRYVPELRFINQYWEQPAYIEAIAQSIAGHWRSRERSHLLFSFHSIPKRYFLAGDPYHCFCQATARQIAQRLDLADTQWSIGFQSRFGREEWLQPYVDKLLEQYARNGPRRVTLVCPGFATDCLETLEEIDMQNRDLFLSAGGESFDYVPCLNSGEAHVNLLEQLVVKHAAGWSELEQPADPATLAVSRTRAKAMGAPS